MPVPNPQAVVGQLFRLRGEKARQDELREWMTARRTKKAPNQENRAPSQSDEPEDLSAIEAALAEG